MRKRFARPIAVLAAVTVLIGSATVPAAAAPARAAAAAPMDMSTMTSGVYPVEQDGRTFDRYSAGWASASGAQACTLFLFCATGTGYWTYDGTNGYLRTQLNGSSLAAGSVVQQWTSPSFVFTGHDGTAPDDDVIRYRLRADTAKFKAQDLANSRFAVQLLNSKGTVLAQNTGKELTPSADWRAVSFPVSGKLLTIGQSYSLRAVTTFSKSALAPTDGTVDWDCVALTARVAGMTGDEGCGAGNAPPDPGEMVMSGGSSPVCYSPLDFLTAPFIATLKQILTGPNQVAAGVGTSTASLVNALLDPAKPFAVAIGDLLGTFAATTSGLSGPAAGAVALLKPFIEAISAVIHGVLGPISTALFQPLAQAISNAAGVVTGPAGAILATLLSPAGALAAPLMPVYNGLVRPIIQPLLTAVMSAMRPALTTALGPNGLAVLGDIVGPLQTAAYGTVGPFAAAIGTLHPIHATLVNLLDPLYESIMTVLGPDGAKYGEFLHQAYVHSFPDCGTADGGTDMGGMAMGGMAMNGMPG